MESYCKSQNVFHSYNADLLISANAGLIREFGSLNQSLTNVIYTNGGIDPWLYTGILASREPRTIVMLIDGKLKLNKAARGTSF